MVFSTRASNNTDYNAADDRLYDCSHLFVPRKRLRTSVPTLSNWETNTCIGDISNAELPTDHDFEARLSPSCSMDIGCGSSSCDPVEGVSSHVAMEGICQSANNSTDVTQSCTSDGPSCQKSNYLGYAQSISVSGWMYFNECSQLCGPYINEQLYEGLSTGFLPEELPVYPVVNGSLGNPVPLKCFKQYPDHVATGFVYLAAGLLSKVPSDENNAAGGYDTSSDGDRLSGSCIQVNTANCTASLSSKSLAEHRSRICDHELQKGSNSVTNWTSLTPFMSTEESCWLFMDGEERNCGPYSLAELYSWHCRGYLHDSLVVSDEI